MLRNDIRLLSDQVHALVDRMPSMIAYWDRNLRCRFANRAYERWFGVDPDALIGTTIEQLLGPELYALNEPYIRAALEGRTQVFERLVPGPDGSQRHSLAHYVPDLVNGAVAGFAVQVTEVTQFKQTEAALRAQMLERERAGGRLRKSEAALRQAQRLGRIGSWEWEIAADLCTWSDELYAIFGLDPTQLPPCYAQHPGIYTAESWARLDAAVQHALRTGEPYRIELEFIRGDGCHGWLEALGEVVRGADGAAVSMHGVAREIGARPAAAAAVASASAGAVRAQAALPFLANGGEMGARIRAFPWTATPLGPPHGWPTPLKVAIGLLLSSQHPMFIFWGADYRCFYNDAYARSLGPEKHGVMLGAPGAQVWPEIWHLIGPQIELVMSGQGSTWHEDHLVPIVRHGRLEDVYWTYGYSPIHDDAFAHGVGGVLVICNETTAQVHEQRLKSFVVQLDDALMPLTRPRDIIATATRALGRQLQAGRVGYGVVQPDDATIVLESNHVDGVEPVHGPFPLDCLGPANIERQRRGEAVVWDDLTQAPSRDSIANAAAYAAIQARALVSVPILEDGRFAASLFVTDRQPRRWTDHELALMRMVAQRIGEVLARTRSEALLQAVFDDAAIPMALSRPDGPFQKVNRAFCALLGFTDAQLMQTDFLKLTHADDLAQTLAARQRLDSGALDSLHLEKRYLHRLGHEVWCDVDVAVLRHPDGSIAGYLTQAQDISARRAAEQAVRLSTQRLHVALKNSQVVVFNQDRELRYTWIHNPALGFEAAQVVGRRDGDLFDRAQDAMVTESIKLEVMRTGAGRRCEVRVVHEGREHFYDLQVEPSFDQTGRIDGVTCAAVDITGRRRIEDELRRSEEALREANRRKDVFIATLSHELRNPLAPIRTAAYVLAAPNADAAAIGQSAAIIARQVTHMATLLDDLLDMSRITRGTLFLRMEDVELDALLNAAIEAARPLIDGRRHRLHLHRAPVPCLLQADPVRLTQVLTNLLNNAARYTDPGGTIALAAQVDEATVRITVSDDGIGIDGPMLAKVFDMFAQVEPQRRDGQGGLGIGLALVKGLVEMHGGAIQVRSAGLDQGSAFTVSLPRGPASRGAR